MTAQSPSNELEQAAGNDELLAAALAYGTRGWPVFPVRGKVPMTGRGYKDASTDANAIRAWWDVYPSAGVGIATGVASGLVVLDEDTQKGGARSLAELERRVGKLPKTFSVLTGGGGRHYYFRHPGGTVPCSVGKLGEGLDLRADGGFVVGAPSPHESGRPYMVLHDVSPAPLPAGLLEETAKRTNGTAPAVSELIPEGRRNSELASIAGTLRRRGLGPQEILGTLAVVNRERCKPPLLDDELGRIAASVGHYQPDGESAMRTVALARPREIDEVVDIFRSWLHLPDPGVVHVTCATVAANRVPTFDPTWLIVVGAAGSGKTETIGSTSRLDGVYVVATLTEAALLSGTPRKDAGADASGGLLREIGDSGLIVLKDFGSVLSMHRDARAGVLAALRELYDGSWTRLLGVDGGRRLHWEGRVGLLAGATSVLDQHHGVMAQLGERFLIYRIEVDDAAEQGRSSLAHHGRERGMRLELAEAVAGLFARLDSSEPPPLSAADTERLVALAVLVARARSPVVRDGYRREIELVPDSEAPGRLVGALARLLSGLRMIGVGEAEAWLTIVKTGLDSMPASRLAGLEFLLGRESATTTEIATALGLPNPTAHRVLEDLAAHGVAARESQGQGKADVWRIELWAAERYREATASEPSERPKRSEYAKDDVSEEVATRGSS